MDRQGNRSLSGPGQHRRGTGKVCPFLDKNGSRAFKEDSLLAKTVITSDFEITAMESGLLFMVEIACVTNEDWPLHCKGDNCGGIAWFKIVMELIGVLILFFLDCTMTTNDK
jgi:hypothetical protein